MANFSLNEWAILFRFIMVFVYGYMWSYFYGRYKKTKKSGFRNDYFYGFSLLFGLMTVFYLLYFTYEMYETHVTDYVDFWARFGWYDKWYLPIEAAGGSDKLWYLMSNQYKPLFLIFFSLFNVVLATQVTIVEKIIGWNKKIVTKTLLSISIIVWLAWIPPIGLSWVGVIAIALSMAGIGIGFLINMFANLILFFKLTGDLRKRSRGVIFAFFFFALGMVWSLELGFGDLFGVGNNEDVIIGCFIQMFSCFLYIKVFPINMVEEEKIEDPNKMTIMDYLTGNFKTRTVVKKYLYYCLFVGSYWMFLAWLCYPKANDYSIMKDTISFLGSWDMNNNPNAWYMLTITMIWFGLTFIPLASYKYQKMKQITKFGAIFSYFFFLFACIGLILVGLFPDNDGDAPWFPGIDAGHLHIIMANFAIGGFAVAIIFDFLWFIIDRIGKKVYPLSLWVPKYIIFWILLTIGIYTQVMWMVIWKEDETNPRGGWPGDGIYSFPLWEWILFILLFVLTYWIILDFDKIKKEKPQKEELD